MKYSTVIAVVFAVLCLSACDDHPKRETQGSVQAIHNPFFSNSALHLQYPPFDQIENEHYQPAIEAGMQVHLAEIDVILSNPEPPTFENTILALEDSGALLARVLRVFYALGSAHTNDGIEAIRTVIAPRLAAHEDAIALNGTLFARVKSVYEQRDQLGLAAESVRLIAQTYEGFVSAGATLDDVDKERVKIINARLAELRTEFIQNVRGEVNSKAIVVDTLGALQGLSENQIEAAKRAAQARDLPDQWVLPLLNTTNQPALSALANRALRERIHKASLSRGTDGGIFDNTQIIAQVMHREPGRG